MKRYRYGDVNCYLIHQELTREIIFQLSSFAYLIFKFYIQIQEFLWID